jgi:ABC-type phosphate/phosphonate transport system ATPase subunit
MKIQSITINKYKAFTKEEKIPVGGSNVFIYGENGSGKSSFYYALKDFFQSSVETVKMAELRNFNLSDGGTDCSIKVEFDGDIVKTLNETAKDTNTTQIIDANRLKSFLTYKHLLGVHNVKNSDKIDVFDLVVNGVLKHFKSELITNNIELGKLWNDVLIEHQKPFGKGKSFYKQTQKKASVESKAIWVNTALDNLFHSTGTDYLAPFVNRVLQKLNPEMEIQFTRKNITVNDNHASSDVGMIFTAYNLRRTFNILDKNLPKAYLKALGFLFSSFLGSFKANFGPVFSGGLAHGVLTTLYLGCCIAIKRGTLDREMGLKWGC